MTEQFRVRPLLCLLLLCGAALVFGCTSNSTDHSSALLGITGQPTTGYAIAIEALNRRLSPGEDVPLAVSVTHNGQPSDGKLVRLVSAKGVTFSQPEGLTVNGWFSSSYQPTAAMVGEDTITAITGDLSTSTRVVIGNPLPAETRLELTLQPTVTYTGQKTTLTVRLRDLEGFPADGTVAFASSLSGAFEATSTAVVNGFAQTTFTAGQEVGTATITVRNGMASASADLQIKVPTTVLTYKNYPLKMKAGETSIISLQIADDLGMPLAGEQVFWSVRPSSAATITAQARQQSDFSTSTNSDSLGYVYANIEAASVTARITVSALLRDQIATISIDIGG